MQLLLMRMRSVKLEIFHLRRSYLFIAQVFLKNKNTISNVTKALLNSQESEVRATTSEASLRRYER